MLPFVVAVDVQENECEEEPADFDACDVCGISSKTVHPVWYSPLKPTAECGGCFEKSCEMMGVAHPMHPDNPFDYESCDDYGVHAHQERSEDNLHQFCSGFSSSDP